MKFYLPLDIFNKVTHLYYTSKLQFNSIGIKTESVYSIFLHYFPSSRSRVSIVIPLGYYRGYNIYIYIYTFV